MDIRIGIINTGRELSFESSESAESIKATVAEAISAGTPLSLTDVKGNSYIVPTANLAFVEVGSEETRRVGFVA
ncbi:DUF3107 domain-containing protein [Microbacterium stercoris]|uniref:DUF3107 domain-containing protein n=1 Tax=Microbacterium stercoris TaxID=2820289 RepID=A0A939QGH1_9MICO|nr:DUF3107 domain-containing protein [Microbacterium stercoris]MBO3662328.1 DUF3107 domain-containing protein [Microbacterium stercoris]MBO3664320.1 DUF3107 domain-containing protein [Microbacterium stercoris]